MENNEKSEFLNAFMTLCEMWEKEPSKNLMDVWWTIFRKYSLTDFQKGIVAALATLKNYGRLPMPSDVIELIETDGVDIETAAEIQASEVITAIKGIGVYQTVIFDDTTTMAVIQQGFGGWVRICTDLQQDEEKWFKKDFVKMYRAFKRGGRKYPGKLIGLFEAENEAKGFIEHIPEPVFIGDSSKQIELKN